MPLIDLNGLKENRMQEPKGGVVDERTGVRSAVGLQRHYIDGAFRESAHGGTFEA